MTIPPTPPGLSEGSQAMWVAALSDYEPNVFDLGLFVHALRANDEEAMARERVEREGMTVINRSGGIVAHPMLDVAHRRRAFFMAAMKQLGLHSADDPPPATSHRKTPGPKPRQIRGAS
jgi:hypothetical protein